MLGRRCLSRWPPSPSSPMPAAAGSRERLRLRSAPRPLRPRSGSFAPAPLLGDRSLGRSLGLTQGQLNCCRRSLREGAREPPGGLSDGGFRGGAGPPALERATEGLLASGCLPLPAGAKETRLTSEPAVDSRGWRPACWAVTTARATPAKACEDEVRPRGSPPPHLVGPLAAHAGLPPPCVPRQQSRAVGAPVPQGCPRGAAAWRPSDPPCATRRTCAGGGGPGAPVCAWMQTWIAAPPHAPQQQPCAQLTWPLRSPHVQLGGTWRLPCARMPPRLAAAGPC